jgi:murein DD-endopeptidase MepM/ murein hydrolase activator NlpD
LADIVVGLSHLSATAKRRAAAALGVALMAGVGATAWSFDRAEHANQIASAQLGAKAAEVARMHAEVVRMREGMALLTATVEATTQRIESRELAINAAIAGKRADVEFAAATTPSASDPRLAVLGAGATRILAPLAMLETHQLALVGQAAGAARARYLGESAAIRSLGLDPHRFVAASSVAMGGPEEPMPAGMKASTIISQAKVQELYREWTRLSALSQAARAIPSRMPVSNFNYTSGFGGRYDPFNGGAAFHAGVDMAGSNGEPILAAAPGTVVRAGWMGGYGNCIEIDHGHGLATRYGHLSQIEVHTGDRIAAGNQIGRMGSTGRSTGSHLHFEVRVDGRAVDPMPYIRAMPQVAAMQAAAAATGMGGPTAAQP